MIFEKHDLQRALRAARSRGLESAQSVLGGYSIETVSVGDRTLEYVNLGDTYSATICHELGTKRNFIGSWGGWYEAAEITHQRETRTIRCGYCSEFTPKNKRDWRQVKCEACGHFVGG